MVTLPDAVPLALRVLDATPLTPLVRRLRLGGDDLAGFTHVPGQDLMLAVPTGDTTINRRYTIRRHHAADASIDVDIVLHGEGPGSRWAQTAAAGDVIAAIGPRGKVVLDADADWHLFACDESGWPATAAMIEALPAGGSATVFAEIADAAERQELAVPGVTVHWIERRGAAPGLDTLLVDAVREAAVPGGIGHAYLSAELAAVRGLAHLLEARGMSPDQVSPKAYWRRGTANAAHGEPLRDTA